LIKQNGANIDSYADNDQIVVYNIASGQIQTPYKGLNISGEAIHSINGNLYIVGQENSLLYKIKT
jgi:hypothetical protein